MNEKNLFHTMLQATKGSGNSLGVLEVEVRLAQFPEPDDLFFFVCHARLGRNAALSEGL